MESTYVSAFQVFNNLYDIKIDFSILEPVTDENGEIVGTTKTVKNRVAMSPALAKELINILGSAITDYENKFGTIPEVKIGEEE